MRERKLVKYTTVLSTVLYIARSIKYVHCIRQKTDIRYQNNQQLTGSLWGISTTSTCILIFLWPSLNESIIEGRKGGSENRKTAQRNIKIRNDASKFTFIQKNSSPPDLVKPQYHRLIQNYAKTRHRKPLRPPGLITSHIKRCSRGTPIWQWR